MGIALNTIALLLLKLLLLSAALHFLLKVVLVVMDRFKNENGNNYSLPYSTKVSAFVNIQNIYFVHLKV